MPGLKNEDALVGDTSFDYFAQLENCDVLILYGCFGSVQTDNMQIYQIIVEACSSLFVQLVLSLGIVDLSKRSIPDGLFPSNNQRCIVVPCAPQAKIILMASVCISHAGLNSTLMSFGNGIPLVTFPITNDQPGIAARVS